MPFLGSRGDIQPGLAVAHCLRDRGHGVTLGVPPNLVEFVRSTGMDCVAMGPDSKKLLSSDLVRRRIRQRNPVKAFGALRELAGYDWPELTRRLAELGPDHDVIVTGLLAQEVAYAVAERFDLTQVALHYTPIRRAARYTTLTGPRLARRRAVAWGAGVAVERGWRTLTRAHEDHVRAILGLPASHGPLERRMKNSGALEIQTFDAELFPELAQEWLPQRPFVGFLDISRELHEQVDPGLSPADEVWLGEGEPPVFFGFGSAPLDEPEKVLSIIVEASRRLGVRALISSGWSALPEMSLDPSIRMIGPVDHTRVFPRCRAVVHHGGAGTTGAALRSGRPSVVCWFSNDQPMWGGRVEALKVGTQVPQKLLSAESLVAALRTALEPGTTQRAAALAARMATPEEAVRTSADLIERVAIRSIRTNNRPTPR